LADKVKENKTSRTVAHVGEMGKPYNIHILVRKPGGKSPLRRPSNRWAYNIKMALKETG
jgi:hypothetical protein